MDTQRLWALKSIRPEFQLGSAEAALVVTTPYEDNSGRDRVHYFLLTRKTNRWLIARAEFGTPEDARKRVEGFQMYPGVRHDVRPEQLVGDWILPFFRHTYLKLQADGSLSLSHPGPDGTTAPRAGTWSINADVYTETIDGSTTTGRITSITPDSFHYALPNGSVVGFERNHPAQKSAAKIRAERAARKTLVETELKLAETRLTRAQTLVEARLAPRSELLAADLEQRKAQARLDAIQKSPGTALWTAAREESWLRLKESETMLKLYRKLEGPDLWNTLAIGQNHKLLNDLLAGWNNLSAELNSLARTYASSHPKMPKATEQLRLVEKQLDQQVAGILKALEIKVAALKQGLDNSAKSQEKRPIQ